MLHFWQYRALRHQDLRVRGRPEFKLPWPSGPTSDDSTITSGAVFDEIVDSADTGLLQRAVRMECLAQSILN